VVAANAVVLEDVPADVVVAGIPARIIHPRDSDSLQAPGAAALHTRS
jgi:serine acetyltransferase